MAKYCKYKNGPAVYLECMECEEKGYCSEKPENKETVKIIVAGTRTFNDYLLLEKEINKIINDFSKENIEIVSGTANGADKLGERFAEENGLKVKRFPANWTLYGKSAGYRRNLQMAEYAGQNGILIAFWDGISRGTKLMIDIATQKNIRKHVIYY